MSQPSASSSAASSHPSTNDAEASFYTEMPGMDMNTEEDAENIPIPRRLIRAECILSKRTSRFLLVLETIQDDNNYQAILRTAESFGVQHVWVVESGKRRKNEDKRMDGATLSLLEVAGKLNPETGRLVLPADATSLTDEVASSAASPVAAQVYDATGTVSMAAGRWLSLRYFASTADCIAALRADQREIWVTSLEAGCKKLDRGVLPLPPRLAIVLGRELDGVSQEMVAAASQKVFLPMIGFSESFNVSVAGALTLQRLFDLAPEAEGDMSQEERHAIRTRWYKNLSMATPGAEADYLEFWLPRHERTIAAMREAVAREGELKIIRPNEETRLPKLNPKVRRRMEKEGQRSVVIEREPQTEQ